ncbi:MAG: phosphomannomutase/phosphoglucomutase [Clostridiales bacterium]|nr:phosphomannomutase/phosphoglucomutase [Clostridiales bacterium]
METDWQGLKSGSDILGAAEGAGAALTVEAAERIGYSFALWLAEREGKPADQLAISVGRDARPSGAQLASAFIHGLTAADADVIDCGLCAAPAALWLAADGSGAADGAAMVTAGQHPSNLNGLKLLARSGGPTGDDLTAILECAGRTEPPVRLVTRADAMAEYQARLTDMVARRMGTADRPLDGAAVAIEAEGVGSFFADLLAGLGARVASPNDLGAPSLADAVPAMGADLGVRLGGDCARAALLDEKGAPLSGNRLIALVSAMLLAERPGLTIVTDSVTSSGLSRFIAEWGGVHYRYKRGYMNVIDEARRLVDEGIDCALAMETGGHAAFRDNAFLDDGVYLAATLLCEALARRRRGERLLSLLDGLREPVERAELRLPLTAPDAKGAAQSVIESVLSHTLDNAAWHLANDNREGVRISFDLDGGVDNGWFMIRLSLSGAVMPLTAESDVPGGVRQMLGQLQGVLADCEGLDQSALCEYLAADPAI